MAQQTLASCLFIPFSYRIHCVNSEFEAVSDTQGNKAKEMAQELFDYLEIRIIGVVYFAFEFKAAKAYLFNTPTNAHIFI